MSLLKDLKQPRQPIGWDDHGVIRFKRNEICDFLIRDMRPGYDMNAIAMKVHRGEFSKEDFVQFCQLIGYSVSGFGDLSLVPPEEVDACDALAHELVEAKKEPSDA
jgi:hypothetical protein